MSETEVQELLQIHKDAEYLNKSYDSLKQKYTNQYIAIKNGAVIAHHKNMRDILKLIKNKKFNPANVLIEYVNPKDMLLIF